MEQKSKTQLIKLGLLQNNTGQIDGVPANPRYIKDKDFEELKTSILVFPQMLYLRPITYASGYVTLGGNQRRGALADISKLTFKQIEKLLKANADFKENPPEDQAETFEFWKTFLQTNEVPAQDASNLSTYKMREFVIKDNVNFGENDFKKLKAEWGLDKFKDWGGKIPDNWVDPEELGDTFKLPSGDKEPFQQITFTLSDAQTALIKQALSAAKKTDAFKEYDFDNQNANGNAIFYIVKELALKHSDLELTDDEGDENGEG